MQRRPFGTTGLEVTPIGLGMAALGRPGYINVGHAEDLPADRSVESMRNHAHRVLDHAHRRGIRYVDMARSYGRAEAFVGAWLEEDAGRAASMTVGSKWGYTYTAGWQVDADEHEVKDHSLETFTRQIAETRNELGTRLDLYQIHSATLETGVLHDSAVMTALHRLADEGVVIGLTLSGPGQAATLERALEETAAGRAPFQAVQATWNLLEPSVGPALAAAAEAGWGVIIKEAVANGRLTPRAELPPSLAAAAGEYGATADAYAIAAALAQPFTSVVLSGAASRAHLDSNLGALDLLLPPDEIEAVTAACAESPGGYWSRRGQLGWT